MWVLLVDIFNCDGKGIKKWAFKMGGFQDAKDIRHLLLVEVVLLVLGHLKDRIRHKAKANASK